MASLGAIAGACTHVAVPHVDSGDPHDAVEATLRNATSGNTLVRCQPADAEVAVDGVLRGLASDFDGSERLLALSAGGHEVSFRHKGYELLRVDVVVDGTAGGGRQTLDVRLTPLGPRPE